MRNSLTVLLIASVREKVLRLRWDEMRIVPGLAAGRSAAKIPSNIVLRSFGDIVIFALAIAGAYILFFFFTGIP